jgi:hypothetical protein
MAFDLTLRGPSGFDVQLQAAAQNTSGTLAVTASTTTTASKTLDTSGTLTVTAATSGTTLVPRSFFENFGYAASGNITAGVGNTLDGVSGTPEYAPAPGGYFGNAAYCAVDEAVEWDDAIGAPILGGSGGMAYFRTYLYFTADQGTYHKSMGFRDAQGAWQINGFSTYDGGLTFRLSNLNSGWSSTGYTVSLDTMYRFELDVNYTAKTVAGRIYSGHSTTPLATMSTSWTTIARTNPDGQADLLYFEAGGSGVYVWQPAFSNERQPGPAVVGGLDVTAATSSTATTGTTAVVGGLDVTAATSSTAVRTVGTSSTITEPSAIPNLYARWRADSASGVGDGNKVTTWTDSVSAIAPTQGTDSKRPTYRASVAALNNQPALEFDRTNSQSLAATTGISGLLDNQDDYTVVVIGRWGAQPGGSTYFGNVFVEHQSSNCVFSLAGAPNSGGAGQPGRIEVYKSYSPVDTIFGADGSVQPNTNFILIASHDTSTTMTVWDRGDQEGTDTSWSQQGDITPNMMRIGAWNDGGDHLTGHIAEILVYHRALTANERAQVDTYARERYGISVSDDLGVGFNAQTSSTVTYSVSTYGVSAAAVSTTSTVTQIKGVSGDLAVTASTTGTASLTTGTSGTASVAASTTAVTSRTVDTDGTLAVTAATASTLSKPASTSGDLAVTESTSSTVTSAIGTSGTLAVTASTTATDVLTLGTSGDIALTAATTGTTLRSTATTGTTTVTAATTGTTQTQGNTTGTLPVTVFLNVLIPGSETYPGGIYPGSQPAPVTLTLATSGTTAGTVSTTSTAQAVLATSGDAPTVVSTTGTAGRFASTDGTLGVTASTTATASRTVDTSGSLALTAATTGTAVRSVDTSGSLAVTDATSQTDTVQLQTAGSLAVTAGTTESVNRTVGTAGSLAATATPASSNQANFGTLGVLAVRALSPFPGMGYPGEIYPDEPWGAVSVELAVSGDRAVTAATSQTDTAQLQTTGSLAVTVATTETVTQTGAFYTSGDLTVTTATTGTVQGTLGLAGTQQVTAATTATTVRQVSTTGSLAVTAATAASATAQLSTSGDLPVTTWANALIPGSEVYPGGIYPGSQPAPVTLVLPTAGTLAVTATTTTTVDVVWGTQGALAVRALSPVPGIGYPGGIYPDEPWGATSVELVTSGDLATTVGISSTVEAGGFLDTSGDLAVTASTSASDQTEAGTSGTTAVTAATTGTTGVARPVTGNLAVTSTAGSQLAATVLTTGTLVVTATGSGAAYKVGSVSGTFAVTAATASDVELLKLTSGVLALTSGTVSTLTLDAQTAGALAAVVGVTSDALREAFTSGDVTILVVPDTEIATRAVWVMTDTGWQHVLQVLASDGDTWVTATELYHHAGSAWSRAF